MRLRGWGRTPHGAKFVVMEWTNGITLWQWRQPGRRSLKGVIDCGLIICRAMAAAHQVGIIHGDLTPNDLLREKANRYVLTHFGFS